MYNILDLSLDPNDTDEPYEALITTTSLILICFLLKYESLPHQDTLDILW